MCPFQRLVFMLAVLAVSAAGQTEQKQVTLDSFTGVQSCAPLNTLVVPSADGAYKLSLDAEPAALSALSYDVVDGTLRLGLDGSFDTTQAIKVTVALPATELASLKVDSTGMLIAAPGFKPAALSIDVTATGRAVVTDVVVEKVTITSSGTADVYVMGNIGGAEVSTDGTGEVFLTGVTGDVKVDLSGTSTLTVDTAADTATITGTASGINHVMYSGPGSCDVEASFPFDETCQKADQVDVPTTYPGWTCGLSVKGSFLCGKPSSGSSTTSNGGITIPGFTSSGGIEIGAITVDGVPVTVGNGGSNCKASADDVRMVVPDAVANASVASQATKTATVAPNPVAVPPSAAASISASVLAVALALCAALLAM